MSVVGQVIAQARSWTPDAVLSAARPARVGMSSLLHRGARVQCPLCGGTFRSFARFHGRRGARCPGCRALERHRMLHLFLRDHTDLFTRPQRVLHIAPEYFLQSRLRSVHADGYISGDVASPDAMQRVDVTALPFPDAAFDVALCAHVFEHVQDDHRAMTELRRVVKADGWAILDAPVDEDRLVTFEDASVTSPRRRHELFGQWDHVRVYGRDYADRLTAAGWSVVVDPVLLSTETAVLHGLRPGVDRVYLCRPA